MKVLENNFIVAPTKARCTYCQSHLLIESLDDLVPEGVRPDIEGYMTYGFQCPCCGGINEFCVRVSDRRYATDIDVLAARAYANARTRGKISPTDSHQIKYLGIRAELKEFLSATDKPSTHLPQYTEQQEELTDILICCLTELQRSGVNIRQIIEDKIAYNEQRND